MSEPAKGRSNLALRLVTAALLVPLLLYSLFLGPRWLFPCFTALVCGLSAIELFAMVAPEHRLIRGFGVAATMVVEFQVAGLIDPKLAIVTTALVTIGALLVSLVRVEPMASAASRAAWSIAGPAYLGALFGLIALLFLRQHGGEWVLLAMICSFGSDTAGYFVGRSLGKRALYPAVSPKKTIEGALGGLSGGLLGGLLAHFWFLPELPLLDAIVLSLMAAAAGQAGDLCESLIKRSTGVKDSGTMLPGHGGFLDRVDALLFSSAVIYLYVSAIFPLRN
jgi:phosphatidate cytidylyltransferase